MAKTDPWPTIHGERQALAADLETLSDEQWAMPSLCEGWTVRDVVAHMTGTARITSGRFLPKLAGSGFSLKRMQAKDIARERGNTASDTLAHFKDVVGSSKHPPGPTDTWLGETIVHAEDVRQPLGIKHEYPADAAKRVADFYKGSNLVIGAKRRIGGLRLTATDTDWSHGEGPEVRGPIVQLLMAMTGRMAATDQLAGEGLAVLRARE